MAANGKSRAEARQRRRRDEVIDAAAAVFAEKGFHAATTRDIADRLGLLPGSLYYYFDSKEAALIEVCRRLGEGFNARLGAILDTPGTVAEKVHAGIAQHLAHNTNELVSTIAYAQRDLPGGAAQELKALGRVYERLWERLFHDAVRAGELPKGFDTRAAAVAVLAMCNGAIHWYEKKPRAEVMRIAARFAALFLEGALPRSPHAAP